MNTLNPEVTIKNKQPKVFRLAFLTSMCERFGYYIVGFLLVLYAEDIYGYSDKAAFALFAIYTALGYLTPAIGGYLADNKLGIKRCLLLGLFCEAIGYTLLALPVKTVLAFFFGLAFIIIGAGLFKTAPTNLLGRAYDSKDDPRIDSGFTLFYMAINIGSFVASLIAGYLAVHYGYHIAFFASAIGLYIGILLYFVFKHYAVKKIDSKPGNEKLSFMRWLIVLCGIIIVSIAVAYFVYNSWLSDILLFIASSLLFIYIIVEIVKSKTREEKLRIIACVILIAMAVLFYILYFQPYMSMMLFMNRNVSHEILGISITTPVFLGFNAGWILICSPILAKIYNFLAKHNKDLAVTTKFPIGIFLAGLSFILLYIASYYGGDNGIISAWWLVLSFLFYSIGELFTGALGVAMVTRIAPKRMYGVLMGAWFLIGSALAANIAGKLSNIASIPKDLQNNLPVMLSMYGHAFLIYGIIGVVTAIICFSVSPFIKKMAGLD